MITNRESLASASPKTKRSVRYEFELEAIARDCVFAANNGRDFKLLMESRVLSDARFERLPIYRQVSVDAYVRGFLDALAIREGLPVSEPPQEVRPRQRAVSLSPKRPSARAGAVTSVGQPGVSFPNVWNPATLRQAARRPTSTGPGPQHGGE